MASAAGTSPAAIAELLDGKSGLVSAVVAHGFVRLDECLAVVPDAGTSHDELIGLATAYRSFSLEHHHLFDLMFSQAVAGFGADVAQLDAVRRIYDAFTSRCGSLLGVRATHPSAIDSATGFVALLHGLAAQERSGILGSTPSSADRRWAHIVRTFIAGVHVA